MDPIFTARPVDCQKECADCARDCPLSQCKRVQNGANQMPDKILKPAYFVALARMAWDGENLRLRCATEFRLWSNLESPCCKLLPPVDAYLCYVLSQEQRWTGETLVARRKNSTARIYNRNCVQFESAKGLRDPFQVFAADAGCDCQPCGCWDNFGIPRQS